MVVVHVAVHLDAEAWAAMLRGESVRMLPPVPGAQWHIPASFFSGGPFVADLLAPVPLTDDQWAVLAGCDWLTVDGAPWEHPHASP